MNKPRLLDLFCGAGGAAMGYHRAGFDVVGVDIKPQPHYPFRFFQRDALGVSKTMLSLVDVIHASPPCQAYTQAQRLQGDDHPDLLASTRVLLKATGLPYVIENVPGAPMESPVWVCGRGLGLDVKRHRWFESNMPLMGVPCVPHEPYLTIYGHTAEWRYGDGSRLRASASVGKTAMGVEWMNRDEMAEAVPPAYTQFIGEQWLHVLEGAA